MVEFLLGVRQVLVALEEFALHHPNHPRRHAAVLACGFELELRGFEVFQQLLLLTLALAQRGFLGDLRLAERQRVLCFQLGKLVGRLALLHNGSLRVVDLCLQLVTGALVLLFLLPELDER